MEWMYFLKILNIYTGINYLDLDSNFTLRIDFR